ncbi:hypothetical protein bpln_2g03180 [Burkholderia plantarii]|nr:hypothetical protein bpln_2g03180 [Burkholderia plantarii]
MASGTPRFAFRLTGSGAVRGAARQAPTIDGNQEKWREAARPWRTASVFSFVFIFIFVRFVDRSMPASRIPAPPISFIDPFAAPRAPGAPELPAASVSHHGGPASHAGDGPLGPLVAMRRASVPAEGGERRASIGAPRRGSAPFVTPLSDATARRIEEAARRTRGRVLTEVEREIGETFMLPAHLVAIAEVARIMNVAVSFRPAGAQTLKRLAAGARPKPHDLSDKTIKPESLARVYVDRHEAERRMEQMRRHDLDGYVGHYGDGRLDGVYVAHTAPGMSALRLKPAPEAPGWMYLPVDHDHPGESLVRLRHTADREGGLVTGDYDMHDAINMSGARGPLGEGQEAALMSGINCSVAAVDPRRPLDQPWMSVVQHGPQYNYLAHMRNQEPGARIDERVARPSLPVAMCDRGTWHIIRTEPQLKRFYGDRGIKGKSGWTGSESGGTPSPGASRRGSLADASASRRGSLADAGASRRGSLADAGASRRGSLADAGASRRGSLADVSASRRGSLADAGAARLGPPAPRRDSGIDAGTAARDAGDKPGGPRRGSATSLGLPPWNASAPFVGARRDSTGNARASRSERALPMPAAAGGRRGAMTEDVVTLAARDRRPPAMSAVAEGVAFSDPFAAAREQQGETSRDE